MNYRSNGKLLITGEYLVLKGAKALAIPVNLGQSMSIKSTKDPIIYFSTMELGKEVFNAKYSMYNFDIIESNNISKAKYIQDIFKSAKKLNSSFTANNKGYVVITNVEFNMQWGLGSSSTLINNIAQWANINPFKLNNSISKGSGYDIACASSNRPIIYQIVNGQPEIETVNFKPSFLNHLSLVYLNKKVATEKNINEVLNNLDNKEAINEINSITHSIYTSTSIADFIVLMEKHENIISEIIKRKPAKNSLFNSFQGCVKSLGAWGGDFVLAASELSFEKQNIYFNNKGFKTVIPLKEFIL